MMCSAKITLAKPPKENNISFYIGDFKSALHYDGTIISASVCQWTNGLLLYRGSFAGVRPRERDFS